jgi:ribosomal protein S18 acetylase RimI-like enzyme
MSIAVLPEKRRQGIGRLLVHAFLDEAHRHELEYIELTTDAHNNDGVNRFYQRLGMSLGGTFSTPEGRMMNEYVVALSEPFWHAPNQ